MAGRRCLGVVAFVAALVLIASTETSWAHPGTNNRDGQPPAKVQKAQHVPNAHVPNAHVRNAHVPKVHVRNVHVRNAHVPKVHVRNVHVRNVHVPKVHVRNVHVPNVHVRNAHVRNVHVPKVHARNVHVRNVHVPKVHARKVHSGSYLRSAQGHTVRSVLSAASQRTTPQNRSRGHAYGRTHTDLAAHPGRASGLFKHTDQRDSASNHQPRAESAPSGGGGQPQVATPSRPQPAQPSPGHQPAEPGKTQRGDHTGPPPAPPSQSIVKHPGAAALVLLHSNPLRFTALPIIVIAVLALGVCGLVGLARLRR